uniref:Uncharacterized protein n=1 Tax=Arundo donax TaxID=35708 RepID=A0A0A9BFT6_ARUDO
MLEIFFPSEQNQSPLHGKVLVQMANLVQRCKQSYLSLRSKSKGRRQGGLNPSHLHIFCSYI